MQYVDVALPIKTANLQESFSYRIMPELLPNLTIGQRVIVPFRNQPLVGTVVGFRAMPPRIRGSLKDITSLAEPFALFNQSQLEFYRQCAKYYAASLGEILAIAGPERAPQTAKKISIKPQASQGQASQPIYGLYQAAAQRQQSYLRLIRKALASKQTLLILFPSLSLLEGFSHFLEHSALPHLVMPASQNYSAYYQAWVTARFEPGQIILGTRRSAFQPLPAPATVIIDQPSEYGYKEEQFPYYHSATIVKLRARFFGDRVILGDYQPRLTDWLEIGQGKLKKLRADNEQAAEVRLVDTSSRRGLVPEGVDRYIQQALAIEAKIGLYYNYRGSGKFYHCLECETAIYCPRCDSLLKVYEANDQIELSCTHCDYGSAAPDRCPVCQSYKLGSAGYGIQSFAKLITERYPDARVAILDDPDDQLPSAYDIVVATHRLVYLPLELQFKLIVTFQTDQILHGPSWSTNETAFLRLSHLKERTERLVIQTNQPEHPAIQATTQSTPDRFYEQELIERTKHNYPPEKPIIRLMFRGKDEAKVDKEGERLYQLLRTELPDSTELIAPSPIGTGKRRDNYRIQIIVKSILTSLILKLVPSSWQLDPDPISFE